MTASYQEYRKRIANNHPNIPELYTVSDSVCVLLLVSSDT